LNHGQGVLQRELKELIVEALMLEDVAPEDIESDAPLFVEGLGLDSIDALEIAMVLEQRYGVAPDEDGEANRVRFACVRSLAKYVAEARTK
jgi:acyl carrier protein